MENIKKYSVSRLKQRISPDKIQFGFGARIFLCRINLLFVLGVLLLHGCDDFIVPDIENKEITILSPVNNYVSSSQNISFLWERVDGATHYHLQVVTLSFADIRRIDADTVLIGNRFTKSFLPGTYEWRIRAENSEYYTPYRVSSFSISFNADLTHQSITLLLPTDSAYLRNSNILFQWYPLSGAEKYLFEIRNQTGGVVVENFETISNSLFFPVDFQSSDLSDGFYRWSVRGINWFSTTQASYRVFAIDRINPGIPELAYPRANDTVRTATVNFVWNRPGVQVSPAFDTLYFVNNQDVILSRHYSAATSLSLSVDAGEKWWKVKSFDKAGNAGELSQKRKFTVILP